MQMARLVILLDSFAMDGHAARIQTLLGRSKWSEAFGFDGIPLAVLPSVVSRLAAGAAPMESVPLPTGLAACLTGIQRSGSSLPLPRQWHTIQ